MKCALHFATKPHSRDICVRGVVLGVLCIIGCPVQLIREVQSNPAISNSVNSKSPLFRRKIEFPWIYPYQFSVIYYQLFRTRLFRIPRYFELIVLSLHLQINPVISNLSKTEYEHKSTAGNVCILFKLVLRD